VHFASSTYSATEGQGPATITVSLDEASAQAVTVGYQASDGSAVAGTDYAATSGTLTFAPGQTSATFVVPLLDDNAFNATSPETVNLSLSGPTNATLGSPNTAALSIAEDNATPSWVSGGPTFTWMQAPTPPPVVTNPGTQTTA